MFASAFRTTAFAFLATSLVACGGLEEDEAFDLDDGSMDSAYSEGKEDAPRTAKFEVFTGTDGRYYFHLLAANGQKVLRSQDYASTTAAKAGIASVKENVANEARVETSESTDGQWYFVVKGGNGAVVAVSELYSTKSNADRALSTVRSTVKAATTTLVKTVKAAFQVFKGLDGKYYFHVRATNGQILVQSQSYTTRAAAITGSQSVTENAPTKARYEIRDARNGQNYFALTATNGQTIAHSELYATRTGTERARDGFINVMKTGNVTPAK